MVPPLLLPLIDAAIGMKDETIAAGFGAGSGAAGRKWPEGRHHERIATLDRGNIRLTRLADRA
jgi:hypothetical protein